MVRTLQRDGDPGPAHRALEARDVLAVVEVVGPHSTTTDRITKPAVYAAAGIPCYWRVELDPFPGQQRGEALPVVLAQRAGGRRLRPRPPGGGRDLVGRARAVRRGARPGRPAA